MNTRADSFINTGTVTDTLSQVPSHAQLVYVMMNPHANGGRTARLEASLQSLLSRAGLAHALLMPPTVQAACQLINALPAASRVIVAGGDGTLHALLPYLLAGGHTLAILPAGSGNDTARAIDVYQLDLPTALYHAIHGTPNWIDIGEAEFIDASSGNLHTTLFISSLSAGFDASISLRAQQGPSWLTGMPRYLWATIRELTALRRWQMQVTVDQVLLHDGPALFATTLNTRSFGGGIPAMPHARPDDGQLNLLLAGEVRLPEVMHLLPRLLAGWHLHQPKVKHQDFTALQIDAAEPVPLAADGEYLGATNQIKIQIRPACLPVVYRSGCVIIGNKTFPGG